MQTVQPTGYAASKDNFDLAIQLFNKAKELTMASSDGPGAQLQGKSRDSKTVLAVEDGKSHLYFNDPSILSLRLLTMSNVACALRRRGELQQSLRILSDAIHYGSNIIVGSAEHMTTCHLNRCAVLSQMKQHSRAVQDAQFAIYYGQEAVANAGSSPASLSDRVVSLAAGYYNLAVQLEHCGRFQQCLKWYRKACNLAKVHLRKRNETRITMEMALESAELAYNTKDHIHINKKKLKEKSDRLKHYRSKTPRARKPKRWKIAKREMSVGELNVNNKAALAKQARRKRPQSARLLRSKSSTSSRNKYAVVARAKTHTTLQNKNTFYSSTSKYRHYGENNTRLAQEQTVASPKKKKTFRKKKRVKGKSNAQASSGEILAGKAHETSSPSRIKMKKQSKKRAENYVIPSVQHLSDHDEFENDALKLQLRSP